MILKVVILFLKLSFKDYFSSRKACTLCIYENRHIEPLQLLPKKLKTFNVLCKILYIYMLRHRHMCHLREVHFGFDPGIIGRRE